MIKAVTVQISQKCNLKCPHCCSASSSIGSDELTTEQILHFFEKLSDLQRVKITGGEPLYPPILPKTMSIIDYCINRAIKVQLNTNGTFKLPQNYPTELITLQVSLDGLEEYHDKHRGKGVFHSAIEFIKHNRDKGYDIIVASVIADTKIGRIIQLANFVKSELKVSQRFQVVSLTGRGEKLEHLNQDTVSNIVKNLELYNIPHRGQISSCDTILSSRQGVTLSFDYEGNIIPCPFLSKYKFGHILDFNEEKIRQKMERELQGITCYYPYGGKKINVD